MQKLTLDLDALAVDSFETLPDAGTRGTVAGHEGPIVSVTGPLCDMVASWLRGCAAE